MKKQSTHQPTCPRPHVYLADCLTSSIHIKNSFQSSARARCTRCSFPPPRVASTMATETNEFSLEPYPGSSNAPLELRRLFSMSSCLSPTLRYLLHVPQAGTHELVKRDLAFRRRVTTQHELHGLPSPISSSEKVSTLLGFRGPCYAPVASRRHWKYVGGPWTWCNDLQRLPKRNLK